MRQLDLFGAFTEVTPEESKPSEKKVAPAKKIEEANETNPPQDVITDVIEDELTVAQTNIPAEEVYKSFEEADEFQEEVEGPIEEAQFTEEPQQILSVEVTKRTDDTNNETVETALVDLFVSESHTTIVTEASGEDDAHIPIDLQVSEIKNGFAKSSVVTDKKVLSGENGALKRDNRSVIFDDGRISVKIKAKPAAAPVTLKEPEKIQKLPQKRGRKSFKEIDAEADLIEIPDDEILNQKQYYSISQVAQWFKVNTSLIRFWENEFDIIKPKKNGKGDRLFRPEDVKNLQLIYHLLRERKYTIEGAKEFLKTNKKKVDVELQLTQTLQKFKGFLLDLKANL
jgi:DNA-binding transcriptional MerR regulator